MKVIKTVQSIYPARYGSPSNLMGERTGGTLSLLTNVNYFLPPPPTSPHENFIFTQEEKPNFLFASFFVFHLGKKFEQLLDIKKVSVYI